MKLSCLQENLAKGLNMVSRAVSTRSTLPVLGNVLLATDNGRLKLSATNLEIVITCWIGAKVETEGSITVPARTINDLIGSLPADRVDLELLKSGQTLKISCARTEANVNGIDANQFPLVPEANGRDPIRIEVATLKEMISQVVFSAATDDSRPTLTGIFTRFERNQITMASTDSFRLSMRTAELPGYNGDSLTVVIPARALVELSRIMHDSMENVHLYLPENRNQIIFDMDTAVLIAQLIAEPFPDFFAVIPQRYKTRTIFNTAELQKACKTADIFAREGGNTARVHIEPGSELTAGYATISATSNETGNNEAQVDAVVQGSGIDLNFNVKFLLDVLNVVNSPQVALETTSSTEPGVVKPVGKDGFLHIIMPMHFGR